MDQIRRIKSLKVESQIFNQITSMDRTEFPQPWSERDWGDLDLKERYQLFVLEEKGELVGSALFEINTWDKQAHLLKLTISSVFRGKSLGRTLLAASLHSMLTTIETCYLEVSVSNPYAVSLYKKMGFVVLNTKKKFYSNGEDAYAMQAILN